MFVIHTPRYPIVERAVSDVRLLSDPAFAASIRDSVNKILVEDRNKSRESLETAEKPTENPEPLDTQGKGPRLTSVWTAMIWCAHNDPEKASDSSNPDAQTGAFARISQSNVENMDIDRTQSNASPTAAAPPDASGEASPLDEDGPQPMQLDSPNTHEITLDPQTESTT